MEHNVFVNKILDKYARENNIINRSVFDLSVFEKWLIDIFYEIIYDNKKIEYNNKIINFAIKLIKLYATENKVNLRSTSDVSKLEEWMITKIYNYLKTNKEN